jgi:DNA-binding GntR family transcriptional regulator
MTIFSPPRLAPTKGSRLKGPETSVGVDGDWSPGLLRSHAYEKLLVDIILGELAPMSVLDERVLATRYATGVAGVRDALGRLALEGLVVRRPRVGTIVAPLDLREIENAFQVRHMLEARTAGLAAEKATAADLIAITCAFDGAEAAIAAGDVRAMLVMDRNFHKAVAAATHNPTLARFVVSLQNVATRFWIWAMEKQSPAEQMADVELHRGLARSIAERDPIAAETAAARLVGDPPSAYR